MTKREMLTAIANVSEVSANEDMMNFINHEIELLDKRKNSSKRTMTKNQKANVEIKDTIFNVLASSETPMTVSELIATDDLNAYSSQKISALLKQMVESESVNKTIEKKVAKFSVVG